MHAQYDKTEQIQTSNIPRKNVHGGILKLGKKGKKNVNLLRKREEQVGNSVVHNPCWEEQILIGQFISHPGVICQYSQRDDDQLTKSEYVQSFTEMAKKIFVSCCVSYQIECYRVTHILVVDQCLEEKGFELIGIMLGMWSPLTDTRWF